MALHSKTWFHKNLSRTNAEERLMKTGKQGAFLVRESESLNGTRVLSVLMANEVRHYKILKSADGKMSLQAQKGVQQHFFESIEHLISYYQIQRDAREFPMPLTEPVLEEGSTVGDDKDDLDSDDEDDVESGESVSKFFMLQMDILKTKMVDLQFQELVDGYIQTGLPRDLKKVESGATRPPNLQKILVLAAGDLYKSLEQFLKRMEFLQDLFDVGENKTASLISTQKSKASSLESKHLSQNTADFEGIQDLLGSCKSQMLALERKTCKILKEYSGNSKQASSPEETLQVIPSTRPRSQTSSRHMQGICQFFQVYKGYKKNKMFISLNMKEGKISFLKSQDDLPDPTNSCLLNNIGHILKDKASKTSLGITVDKKMTTYVFEDFKSRELFCQMIEQGAGSSSNSQTSLNRLSVFVGTWNMANASPPEDISSWVKGIGGGQVKEFDVDSPYDIVALGTQESGLNEKEWITKLKETLMKIFNIDYKMIAKRSLWDIRLVVFSRPLHVSKIHHLKQSTVATGIANTLGNKGAVGISFYIGKTSFCFVNCHLSARTARIARRNQNFHDILRGLNLGQDNVFDISCQFHHLFWFGDLNYRIDNLEIADAIKKIMRDELSSLQEHDQLAREKGNGNAFFGFAEEKPLFRPTYRFKIGGNNCYIYTKRKPGAATLTNLPSWCDRVLRKSFPGMKIKNTAYGATEDICTSDHAPVFSVFDVEIISQSVKPDRDTLSCQQDNVKIEFLEINAKVRTSSKTKFIISFHSTCLEEAVSSKPNSNKSCKYETRNSDSEELLYSFPGWSEADLPQLFPALSDQGYLEDQHLLIAIKGDDGHESYGECVLSLKQLLDNTSEDFVSVLTHLGDESGEIQGRAKIDLPKKNSPPSKVDTVPDLKSMKINEDDRSTDSGNANRRKDLSLRRSRQSASMANYVPQTYELVGGFAAGDDNTDSPPVMPALPPKKRLSRGLSNPLTLPKADNTSDIIWIADSPTKQEPEFFAGNDEPPKELPPPPVPRRLKDIPSTSCDPTPVPKPRSSKSLTKKIPKSFNEWLTRINCSQYFESLCEAGWDDLDYLDFDDQDLKDAGVDEISHREKILQSAKIINNHKNKLAN